MSFAKHITETLKQKYGTNVAYVPEHFMLELFGDRKRYHTTIAGDFASKCANLKESYMFEMVKSVSPETNEMSRYVKITWRVIPDDVFQDRMNRMKESQRKFVQKKKNGGVENTVSKVEQNDIQDA